MLKITSVISVIWMILFNILYTCIKMVFHSQTHEAFGRSDHCWRLQFCQFKEGKKWPKSDKKCPKITKIRSALAPKCPSLGSKKPFYTPFLGGEWGKIGVRSPFRVKKYAERPRKMGSLNPKMGSLNPKNGVTKRKKTRQKGRKSSLSPLFSRAKTSHMMMRCFL